MRDSAEIRAERRRGEGGLTIVGRSALCTTIPKMSRKRIMVGDAELDLYSPTCQTTMTA